jgi:hypothetical protein
LTDVDRQGDDADMGEFIDRLGLAVGTVYMVGAVGTIGYQKITGSNWNPLTGDTPAAAVVAPPAPVVPAPPSGWAPVARAAQPGFVPAVPRLAPGFVPVAEAPSYPLRTTLPPVRRAAPYRTFHGYECLDDCSGHEAGYEWAELHMIFDPDDCGGNSQSFIEGCRAFAGDEGPEQEDDPNDQDDPEDDPAE